MEGASLRGEIKMTIQKINMDIHVNFETDLNGDTVDAHWYCSESCFNQDMERKGENFTQPGAYPGGSETDYCTYCTNCSDHLWTGNEHDGMCRQCQFSIL